MFSISQMVCVHVSVHGTLINQLKSILKSFYCFEMGQIMKAKLDQESFKELF
jgi:hypothetical protein